MKNYAVPVFILIAALFGYDMYDANAPVSLSEEAQSVATAVEDVVTAQEVYYQKNGKYLQVKADGKTPDGKDAKDELMIDVVGFETHEYTMPTGEKGFFILTTMPDGQKAVIDYGNGGFTYIPPPPVIIPPSTTTDEK